MNRKLLTASLAVVALIASIAPANAQNTPLTPRADALNALFAELPTEAHVRLLMGSGTVEEGWLDSVEPGGIYVARDGRSHAIGFADVRSVEVEGGHGIQGAIWGLAGGILAGSVFGLMYGSFDCTTASSCSRLERQGAWRWGIVGGAVGAGVGFWWGRKDTHWHPVFP